MKALAEQIGDIDGVNIYGRVVGVRGLMVEIAGPIHAMSVGARIVIDTGGNRFIPCEVIGFTGNNAVVMPFAGLDGVRRGCRAVIGNYGNQVRPSPLWLGRVLNAMGEPIDGKGPLAQGASPVPYRNTPPPAHSRKRVGSPLDLYNRPVNLFVAGFIGSPKMNLITGAAAAAEGAATIGIRPEHIVVARDEGAWNGTVSVAEHVGSDTFLYVHVDGIGEITVRAPGEVSVKPGDPIGLTPPVEHIHRFDKEGRSLAA